MGELTSQMSNLRTCEEIRIRAQWIRNRDSVLRSNCVVPEDIIVQMTMEELEMYDQQQNSLLARALSAVTQGQNAWNTVYENLKTARGHDQLLERFGSQALSRRTKTTGYLAMLARHYQEEEILGIIGAWPSLDNVTLEQYLDLSQVVNVISHMREIRSARLAAHLGKVLPIRLSVVDDGLTNQEIDKLLDLVPEWQSSVTVEMLNKVVDGRRDTLRRLIDRTIDADRLAMLEVAVRRNLPIVDDLTSTPQEYEGRRMSDQLAIELIRRGMSGRGITISLPTSKPDTIMLVKSGAQVSLASLQALSTPELEAIGPFLSIRVSELVKLPRLAVRSENLLYDIEELPDRLIPVYILNLNPDAFIASVPSIIERGYRTLPRQILYLHRPLDIQLPRTNLYLLDKIVELNVGDEIGRDRSVEAARYWIRKYGPDRVFGAAILHNNVQFARELIAIGYRPDPSILASLHTIGRENLTHIFTDSDRDLAEAVFSLRYRRSDV